MLDAVHLFANHKVTGPAELALESARAVLRTGRVRATFVSSDVLRTRYRDRWLQLLVRERGVPEPEGLASLRLAKHFFPWTALRDAWRLASWLDARTPAVVHCHLPNDHLVATWARGSSRHRPAIVRTVYDGEAPRPSWRARRTLGTAEAVVCLSRRVADELRTGAARYGLDPARVRQLDPPIDAVRFDPARPREKTRDAKRAELGLPPGAFTLGIVARMQTHRRFEVLLEAVREARRSVPGIRLLIVGRGTNQDAVAREPVRALGLEDAVVFSGYQSGEDYVATLASMDAKAFLVPGSDGSCRAVREALAMGLPVIATRRGMLPELVLEGQTGQLVEEDPAALAGAIVALASDPPRRATLGARAREDALRRFSFATFGERLADLYEEVAPRVRAGAP